MRKRGQRLPNWNEILDEVRQRGSNHDIIRRDYLKRLHEHTHRNVIIYYSGWLQKSSRADGLPLGINDSDKTGFMSAINKLDTSLGLDLLLHTPGGESAATESLVDYLRSKFGTDIRAIVPQLAMSAGTMIACASKEVIMGKHSSLGPIDPQIGGIPAHGIIEEFDEAVARIKADPRSTPIWQVLLSKYPPAFVNQCRKAIQWSEEMVTDWLISGMLTGEPDTAKRAAAAKKIVNELGSHAITKSHARHISVDKARAIGLKVVDLEADQTLQELILTVHHCCIHTLTSTGAYKIIENHNGVAYVNMVQQIQISQ
jgi:ClpP class serine protease